MDLTRYEQLTGKTVPEAQQPRYNAIIAMVQSKLETLLGWSFTPQVLYQEKGISKQGCVCPDIPESLDPADEVQGIIKVFPYNAKDKFLLTDPFTEVYKVKLGRVLNHREFITYKTFDFVTKQYFSQEFGKYIEKCATCACECDCKDCITLIVDGDWINQDNLPLDLAYLFCEMVDYYVAPDKDIQSESVDGHSWSRTKESTVVYEDRDIVKKLLAKYAGPYGAIIRVPTI